MLSLLYKKVRTGSGMFLGVWQNIVPHWGLGHLELNSGPTFFSVFTCKTQFGEY